MNRHGPIPRKYFVQIPKSVQKDIEKECGFHTDIMLEKDMKKQQLVYSCMKRRRREEAYKNFEKEKKK